MPKYRLEALVEEGQLQKGDIILSHVPLEPLKHPGSIVSAAIRKITNSHWSHSAMYLGNGKVLEADWDGVVIDNLVRRYKNTDISFWRHKKIREIDEDYLVADARKTVGKDYDFGQLFDLIPLFIFRGRWKKRAKAGSVNKIICSEACSRGYYRQGFPVMKKYTYDKIAPCDFSRSINFRREDHLKYVLRE